MAQDNTIDQETTECWACGLDIGSRAGGFVCDTCGRLYCNQHADDEIRDTDVCPHCREAEFVPCRDPNEYDLCEQCKAELRALGFVIEGQDEEDRPFPNPDDHLEAAADNGRLCGGDHCSHPPSVQYLSIRQNPQYGDQEIEVGSWDELVARIADTIIAECGATYETWRQENSLSDEPWNVLRWYNEEGEKFLESVGNFTLYPLAGEPEVFGGEI